MKVAEASEDFISKLASTKLFGMIDGRGEFLLTERARTYFFPSSDSAKRAAFISFLEQPQAFAVLLKTFDGSELPEQKYIANELHQKYGLPELWSVRVANFFIRSAETVGVLDGTFLRYNAAMQSIPAASTSDPSPESSAPLPQSYSPVSFAERLAASAATRAPDEENPVAVWTYPCAGTTVRVETPENLSPAVWERLNRYIQVLKPD
jgi:hypothetical protein